MGSIHLGVTVVSLSVAGMSYHVRAGKYRIDILLRGAKKVLRKAAKAAGAGHSLHLAWFNTVPKDSWLSRLQQKMRGQPLPK